MTAATACRTCGTEAREGARFCDGCGAPITERDAHFKALKSVLLRLAEIDAAAALNAAKPQASGLRVIARAFDEASQPEYLNYFATQLAKSEKTIALLGRSECGHLIFAQHPSAGKDMNALLKQVLAQLTGKGGGTRDFARGKLSDAAQVEKAVEVLKAELANKKTTTQQQ